MTNRQKLGLLCIYTAASSIKSQLAVHIAYNSLAKGDCNLMFSINIRYTRDEMQRSHSISKSNLTAVG